jgi:hypothetical protein
MVFDGEGAQNGAQSFEAFLDKPGYPLGNLLTTKPGLSLLVQASDPTPKFRHLRGSLLGMPRPQYRQGAISAKEGGIFLATVAVSLNYWSFIESRMPLTSPR